jgi:hypothetical protein
MGSDCGRFAVEQKKFPNAGVEGVGAGQKCQKKVKQDNRQRDFPPRPGDMLVVRATFLSKIVPFISRTTQGMYARQL